MQHSDFKIGDTFWTRTGRWQVTDIGSRTVIAIKYPINKLNLNGPPYSIAEQVMDEYDIDVLYPSLTEMLNDFRIMGDQEGIDNILSDYNIDGEFKTETET